MGFHYEWFNETRDIMICRFTPPWTWEEYQVVGPKMAAEITQRGIPVANLVDVTKMGALPPGNPLVQLQKAGKTMPKNLYASAIVGAPYGATVFMDILMRLQPQHKQKMFFVKTIEEALEHIQKRKALFATTGKTSARGR